jgi:hypothetical protein
METNNLYLDTKKNTCIVKIVTHIVTMSQQNTLNQSQIFAEIFFR